MLRIDSERWFDSSLNSCRGMQEIKDSHLWRLLDDLTSGSSENAVKPLARVQIHVAKQSLVGKKRHGAQRSWREKSVSFVLKKSP